MAEFEKNYFEKVRIIAITSGKGGVGKSSITINLALALAKKGKKILLLDGDIGLANVDIMLGVKPEKNISSVLSGEATLKEVILRGPHGLMLIPGGSGFANLYSLNTEQKLILLSEIESLDEHIDYLLIDTPAGLGNNVRFLNSCAVENVVVVNPEPTSITDSYALIKILNKDHHIKHFSIIINNVSTEGEATRVFKKISDVSQRFLNISLNYLGHLPFDKMLSSSIKEQNPLMNRKGITPYVVRLEKIISKMESFLPEDQANGNIQFFFKRMMEL